jgi:hypothetical protein
MLFGLPENARIIQYNKPYHIVRYREKLEIVIRRPFESVLLSKKKMVYSKHPISLSFQ